MAKQGALGLIVDREQLCTALGISDSSITAWEKKGLPVIRRGRGRGMKSLYSLDAVREWCSSTGYGHSMQALLSNFSRTEPPPAPAPVQTSAPPAPRRNCRAERLHRPWLTPGGCALDPYDVDTIRVAPGIEVALQKLPAILAGEGLDRAAIARTLDKLFAVMRRALEEQHEPSEFITFELSIMRDVIENPDQ